MQERVQDMYLHVSPPLVVRTAWNEQLQRWIWMEYLDELREVADVPRQGVVAVRAGVAARRPEAGEVEGAVGCSHRFP